MKFCQYCGAPASFAIPSENESETIPEEPAFIAEEPAVIAEETGVPFEQISAFDAESEDETKPESEPVQPSYTAPAPTVVLEKDEKADTVEQAERVENNVQQSNAQTVNTDYSERQNPVVVESVKRIKKLNIPATVAVCVVFSLLIIAFSAVGTSIVSIRKTLDRGAVSEEFETIQVGKIVVGDTTLADGIVAAGSLDKNATISDVVIIKLEEYEKYVVKGMFEQNNVTVEDIKNIENIDLERFVGKIEGINNVNELDIDAIINNFDKLDKNEINTIVNKYSNEDFPELTFEIDKRRVEDLLNEKNSPVKDYVCKVIEAYETYLLTGKDKKHVTEESLYQLSSSCVNYVLDGMNSAYKDEINKEMAQVVSENKVVLNSLNPSAAFGLFGSILPMSLSNVTVIVMFALAVIMAVVVALITKRIDAAALSLGISLAVTGGAGIGANLLPANLSKVVGLGWKLVDDTAAELVKDTFVPDFTIVGVITLLIGIAVIIGVVLAKVISRAVKNKKANG